MSEYHSKPGVFAKGNPGRPPGTHIKTIPVRERLKAMNFDWVQEAVDRYRHPDTPNASKDYCLGLLVDRADPKLKAVEITGNLNTDANRVMINIISGEPTVTETVETTVIPTVAELSHSDHLTDMLSDDEISVESPSGEDDQ